MSIPFMYNFPKTKTCFVLEVNRTVIFYFAGKRTPWTTPSLTTNSNSPSGKVYLQCIQVVHRLSENLQITPFIEKIFFLNFRKFIQQKPPCSKIKLHSVFMRFYIYSRKLHNKAPTVSDNKIEIKYKLEKFGH